MKLEDKQSLVFIGDSITDCGRTEEPEGLGGGYVRMIRDYLHVSRPAWTPRWYNRGVSGETIVDLRARWEEDVIALQPDVLTVSIGINDEWKQVPLAEYRRLYEELLTETRQATGAALVLMETTIISEDPEDGKNARLTPYNEAIREIAARYDAVLVPQNRCFESYLRQQQGKTLTYDQVHMNSTGNWLIARNWLEACGAL